MATASKLRTVKLTACDGQRYTLHTYDSGCTDDRGQTVISYQLRWHCPNTFNPSQRHTVLFEGSDFAGSPLHADDSDECMRSLFTFLTLQRGDTDASYFESYTQAQLDWSAAHAGALSLAVMERFGEG